MKSGKNIPRACPRQGQTPINTQADLRGAPDAAALYRRYHNDDIQARTLSNQEHSAELAVMEQAGEALGARQMDGVAST